MVRSSWLKNVMAFGSVVRAVNIGEPSETAGAGLLESVRAGLSEYPIIAAVFYRQPNASNQASLREERLAAFTYGVKSQGRAPSRER